VQIEILNNSNLFRAWQLFNKTNQMNLSTRRLTDAQLLSQYSRKEQHRVWTFRVQDRFGDYGLVGIASLEWDNGHGKIVDFILSCRAFGRRIEEAMLYMLLLDARELGLSRVEAFYLATAKNQPTFDFFNTSGFEQYSESTFAWEAAKHYPPPPAVRL